MSAPALDFGVVIDVVRVFTGSSSAAASAPVSERGASWPVRARAGDHRIIIGELRIEADADWEVSEAHLLGRLVACELTEGLAALQARRLQAIWQSGNSAGSIWIRMLHARLRGTHALHPSVSGICRELLGAIEGRLAF